MADKLCAVPGFASAPANCCGPPPSCATNYQRKTATVSLCGFDEFVASVPPKRYFSRVTGGSIQDCEYYFKPPYGPAEYCAEAKNGAKTQWTGSTNVTNSNCLNGTSPANGNYSQNFSSGTPDNCNANVGVAPEPINPYQYDGRAVISPQGWAHQPFSRMSAFIDWVQSLGCFDYFNSTRRSESTVYCQLANEDTDQTAMARKSGTIANWTSCGPCSSYRATRGAGQFEFGYQELQVQVVASNVPNPAQSYYATIQVYSRAYGTTDPFLPHSEVVHQFQGTTLGNYISPWLQFPIDTGHEFQGQGCVVTVQSPP